MKTGLRTSRAAARAATGALAALVVLALAGCGSISNGDIAGTGATNTTGAATSHTPASASSAPASASTAASPSRTPVSEPTAVPTGGPVPAGFAATSVTFVSLDQAFVLGTAPCVHKPCTSIVRTLDRGASWRGLPAPVVPLGQPENTTGPAAWGIRFASPSHGFVFGNGLWETADGGEHWAAASAPDGSILSLEVIDGQVLAVQTLCSPTSGSNCLQRASVVRRPLAGGNWQTVRIITVRGSVNSSELIATQAGVAALLDGTKVLVTSNGGLSVTEHATPCDTMGVAEAVSVAVTGPTSLALLCSTENGAMGSMAKSVFVSSDLGATWTRGTDPSIAGDPWQVSGGTPGKLVVGAYSGASWLYYSGDGAAHWSTALQTDNGGAGWNDLGFTSTTDGVVVNAPALDDGNHDGRDGQLLLTSDGGASWHAVTW
jgi:hypothetical protein